MKRRYFLGSLGLSVLIPKNWTFGFKQNQNETTDSIDLKAGQIFELPASPANNQRISFYASKDWLFNPATVKRNGNLIMGYDMDLTLDTLNDFHLTFDKKNKTWIIS